jgi:hypothetical protein
MIQSLVLFKLEKAIIHYLMTNDESKVLELIPAPEWEDIYCIYKMRPWSYDADSIQDDLLEYYFTGQV